ncbi:MAG TPA: GTP-binding protein [Sphingomicrobium sp.]|nr:GTP-binding protein [Sphingomicrobium sp.]
MTTPLTLITGFLGSGKTTLLNEALAQANGLRIAVIVNEFGALNVDGRLIAERRGPVIELVNGCICCTTGSDLVRTLGELERMEGSFDAILIETSGLADPGPIISNLSSMSRSSIELAAVVTVVDAENFDANLDRAEAAFMQLATADLAIINKADLVAADVPGRIADAVRRFNRGVGTVVATAAKVPLELILCCARTERSGLQSTHPHRHDDFETVTLRSDAPVDLDCFRAFVDALPPGILRVKGFVRVSGYPGLFAFNRVGARVSTQAIADDCNEPGAALVLIGHAIDAPALEVKLKECTA